MPAAPLTFTWRRQAKVCLQQAAAQAHSRGVPSAKGNGKRHGSHVELNGVVVYKRELCDIEHRSHSGGLLIVRVVYGWLELEVEVALLLFSLLVRIDGSIDRCLAGQNEYMSVCIYAHADIRLSVACIVARHRRARASPAR